MNRYEVKVPASFWKTLVVLKPKYFPCRIRGSRQRGQGMY